MLGIGCTLLTLALQRVTSRGPAMVH
jgi:hypothetical protein